MKVLFIILILALFLPACGPQPTTDPELEPLIRELALEFNNKTGRHLAIYHPVVLGDLPIRVGQCKGGVITIDKSFYDRNIERRPELIKVVLLHEIGHCAYNLEHNDQISSLKPVSIMHPNIATYGIENNLFDYFDEIHSPIPHPANPRGIE